MKSNRARRPSPAMIVALIALFVALGGSGYAALKLPKNSVSTKQIKKNAVTKAKIKKNAVTGAKVKKASLTGSDINLAKLGTVPSAQSAATATLANSISPPEPVRLVGAPGQPSFLAGSSNAPSAVPNIGFNPVGFYKDQEGMVHLQGVALVGKVGALAGGIFTLPPGYRPGPGRLFAQNVFCQPFGGDDCPTDSPSGDSQNSATLAIAGSNVASEGIVLDGIVIGASLGAMLSLDGISFRAES